MKVSSMQFKFLMTIISAMLAVTIFIGGLSIYELDNFVQKETENFVKVSCEKEAAEVNDIFGGMETSVNIMSSYILDFIDSEEDLLSRDKQNEIMAKSEEMFIDVAKYTDGALAYYMRFDPSISDSKTGFFYSKLEDSDEYVALETTDLSLYDRNDTERVGWYWQPYYAGEAVWLNPYLNQNNGMLITSYVIPLYFEGRFIGIVGMDFDYTDLTERVHDIEIYENGFAHLELDGEVIHDHADGTEDTDHVDLGEYLRSKQDLLNGMTLVLSASYDDIRQIRYEIGLKIVFIVVILALLFSTIVIFIVRKTVEPLERLTDASKKLANGDYDVEIVHSNTYEIRLLSLAFENMTMHLREHEKLQYLLAYRDSLTGLRNTTSYKAWVGDFDKDIANKDTEFGVIVFDLNYLKEANDRYGHDVGNKLIIAASRIISGVFKRSPVFRIGGDEFLVILQNRDLANCQELLLQLENECANELVETGKDGIPVSIASGFAKYDSNKDSKFVDVFNRADDAMYKNKRKKKESDSQKSDSPESAMVR